MGIFDFVIKTEFDSLKNRQAFGFYNNPTYRLLEISALNSVAYIIQFREVIWAAGFDFGLSVSYIVAEISYLFRSD